MITPVIKNVDRLRLCEIRNQSRELVELAKENKLTPEQYQGGTFSVSNLGGSAFGVKSFTAIINPPQSAILALGKIDDETNKIEATLCCDHRVIDGAVGRRWLKQWKSYVENPLKLL